MKKRKTMIWCGFFLFPLIMQAQEQTKTANDRIGFEFGYTDFLGETVAPEQVRASKPTYGYYDYYGYPDMNQVLGCMYGGVKYESFFLGNRLGLSTGFRFSQFSSNLSADWNQKYFVWMLRQDETATDYLIMDKIGQKNYYLGVPVEVRYFLKKKRNRNKKSSFNAYAKMGTSVNYCFLSSNSIRFHDPAMNKYTNAIEEQIDKPSPFNAWIYPAFGFRMGRMQNFWINAEFHGPGFLIGEKAHPFIRQDAGMGIQISVQIPL